MSKRITQLITVSLVLASSVSTTSVSAEKPRERPARESEKLAAQGRIAFVRRNDEGQLAIFLMNADGTETVQLTDDSDADYLFPDWSPDGSQIMFEDAHSSRIAVVPSMGGEPIYLTGPGSGSYVFDGNARWSPDGSQIVFSRYEPPSPRGIYIMDSDGGNVRRLSAGGDFYPVWSPDGAQIAFSRIVQSGPPCDGMDIFVMNSDGTHPRRVTRTRSVDERVSDWSQDGSRFLFNRGCSRSSSGIFSMDAEGGGITRLTSKPDWFARWSPDGRRIVFGREFESGAFGRSEILLMDADGTDVVRLTNGGNNGGPAWEPSEPAEYVALGDSYSSGEGLPPFEERTDIDGSNMCHRSEMRSYSSRIVDAVRATRVFGACSGAIVSDFYNSNFSGNLGEGPQLDHLSSGDDLVTLSIGGNDLGFSWVIEQCVRKKSDCSKDPNVRQRLDDGIRGLREGRAQYCLEGPGFPGSVCVPASPSLDQLFRDIAARAPDAGIVVGTYPSLFPRDPQRRCNLENVLTWVVGYPLTVSEMEWLNDQGLRLNRAIVDEAADARSDGTDVRVANVFKSFGDHGLCTGHSWIIGARTEGFALSPFSLHPTERGQKAMADAFLARM